MRILWKILSGIAIGSGSDIAKETGGIILIKEDHLGDA